MISESKAGDLIRDVLEQGALLVGGLAATRGIEDDVVWDLMHGFDAIRIRSLRRLDEVMASEEESLAEDREARPHPAIEHFLAKLRKR